MSFKIAPVRTADDLTATAALFRAYAASLDVDLAYQDFETELASLPGKYAAPHGALLLARCDGGVSRFGAALGCVALRALHLPGAAEMKRLYVAPEGRALGLGKRLAEAIMNEARHLGYREIRLDTLPTMTDAQALYLKLGFEVTAPYYDTPIAGTVFLRRTLA